MKSMLDYIKKEEEINNSIIENEKLLLPLSNLRKGTYRDVVIFATGSSSNAAQSAYIFMQETLQIPVYIKEPSIAMNYERKWSSDTLYLAISQGGRSYSTIELVKYLQSINIQIFVLTSDLNSPIADVGHDVIDLGMGIEEMPYVTAGYTATILVLWLLALEVGFKIGSLTDETYKKNREEIKKVICLSGQIIETTDEWYQKNEEDLIDKRRFVFIGYGASYGVAKEAETKFTEILHLPAHGHELEEYMHGPYLGLQKEDALFLIDANGKLSERMLLLRKFLNKHMDKTYLVTNGNEGQEGDLVFDFSINENMAPLIMTIPFHLISFYISQKQGTDLTKSYYPDFDKITGSKV